METALANNEELHKINEEKEHLKKINEKLDRVNLEFKQETDKKSLNINELTNENLSLKNALNKAKNQIDLLENQHKLNLAEQEQSFRAKMHETESLWSDKQKKEMELFKTDLMISFEKLKQEKQELEEEIYKVNSSNIFKKL